MIHHIPGKLKFVVCVLLGMQVVSSCKEWRKKDPALQGGFSRFVDPFIGTGGHGHTFPGATLPFGMIQLSPDTRADGSWDGCSGYHASDKIIYGFSHTHLSGTGCSDYGDILLMPTTGEPSLDNMVYSSGYSHAYEKASPGYYAVKLDKGDILVELAATLRAGIHKYIFPKAGTGNIVIDLLHRDKTLESRLEVLDKTHLEGMRRSQAWAKDQHIYFSLEFSKPFKTSLLLADAKEGESMTGGKDRGGVFTFETAAGDSILVKIGISTVSIEGARKNLRTEIPGWNFQEVRNEATAAWDRELGKIEVSGPDKDKQKVFYTALYHTMIQPNLSMDVDSSYRGRDNKIHKAKGFSYYSVFSLWDTFRAAHPLYTIIEQDRTVDFIKTFLAQYQEGGRLPVWELAGNETDCMIGYHAVPVIVDAAMKGIGGFDPKLAFEAMKKSATTDLSGIPAYRKQGYLSMDDESESVSKTLEYAYDDWCISNMAYLLNKEDDRREYLKRSQSYRNVFDPESGFMRPRKNGCWLQPFDPKEVDNNYTEANAWQYTFFVPQDLSRYMQLMGGKEKFEAKLDSLFTTSSKTTGREQADITGLIGQYAHGNEPSHHIAYLYNYCCKPWKTQQYVHQILSTFYSASPDGLIGNEDCGQMSAWYVLSSMGFYPVTPGSPQYAIGAPLFNSVRIHLENGKLFTIHASNLSEQNYYVQQVTCSHVPFDPLVLFHQDIMNGETVNFEMGPQPNTSYASKSGCSPAGGAGNNTGFVTVPVFRAESQLFRSKEKISIEENQEGTKVYYTTDGSTPDRKSKLYTKPFSVETSTTVKAIASLVSDPKVISGVTTAAFHKLRNWWTIQLKSTYSPQYSAGGDDALIDETRGDLNWRKGGWQGYQGKDFEAVIDLGKEQSIKKLSAGFLQDEGAWIIFPREVDYFLSSDGKKFRHIVTVDNPVSETDETVQIRDFTSLIRKQNARYVKIRATNYGKLPSGHPGKGENAFLFVDELMVE
jgi:predicted alpha-1,2-mannosidase